MTVVLVPAYRPDGRLPALLAALRRLDPRLDLLVVDDGSPGPVLEECRALGATVLHHGVNRGKGAALRTGFAHVALVSPGSAVVTADADGQHLPEDVVRVAAAVGAGVVLGVRSFGGDDVPLRSRVGNRVSAVLVRAATGRALVDTQTGLRGFAPDLLPWLLTVTGDRFEYELRVLLEAARRGTPIEQLPIATVYLEGNASSHFSPVRDSLRVYRPLALFLLSSLSAFVVDLGALLVLGALTGSLWVSVVGARLLSGTVNYQVNRRVVFSARGGRRTVLGYAALAGSLLAANLALISALTWLGASLLAAKLTTEVLLVGISFTVQRCAVFRRRRAARAPDRQIVISGGPGADLVTRR
ncbi:Glycosyltransferase involved in cell wall bisynthesis [Klenkia soli]|uniref:Glycosyltransferase involved in cell wall bisynthesis n=1 Tax=Klenkia soli TaxID=1052260 RepID=A0A1H0EWX3_9ACTN|nr:glycosyltransferase family 2 protein [Klenkia soli]SDN86937.1 Glycosyltransferase involved in cell wall bisynthesis [Klenkia soli]